VKLIDFDETDHLKYESCRVIALLAKNQTVHEPIISCGGLPALSTLLQGKFDVLKLEACLGIQSLVDNGHAKQVAFTPGIVTGLLAIITDTTPDLKEGTKLVALSVIRNIVRIPELETHASSLQNKVLHVALIAI